ncbi:putative holin-like toxin [Metasolibacillus sp.]
MTVYESLTIALTFGILIVSVITLSYNFSKKN